MSSGQIASKSDPSGEAKTDGAFLPYSRRRYHLNPRRSKSPPK
jgi:hypothetical protein